MSSAEGEQLLRQTGCAFGHAAQFVNRFPQRAVERDRVGEFLAVAEEHGNEVVEVVRDSRREVADGFHLLRLPELSIELITLGDVARDQRHADYLAVADQHSRVRVNRDPRPFAGQQLCAKRSRRAVCAFAQHALNGVEVRRIE